MTGAVNVMFFFFTAVPKQESKKEKLKLLKTSENTAQVMPGTTNVMIYFECYDITNMHVRNTQTCK